MKFEQSYIKELFIALKVEWQSSEIGKRIILPASFIVSPRDIRKRYMYAMALVQKFGKLDIF